MGGVGFDLFQVLLVGAVADISQSSLSAVYLGTMEFTDHIPFVQHRKSKVSDKLPRFSSSRSLTEGPLGANIFDYDAETCPFEVRVSKVREGKIGGGERI